MNQSWFTCKFSYGDSISTTAIYLFSGVSSQFFVGISVFPIYIHTQFIFESRSQLADLSILRVALFISLHGRIDVSSTEARTLKLVSVAYNSLAKLAYRRAWKFDCANGSFNDQLSSRERVLPPTRTFFIVGHGTREDVFAALPRISTRSRGETNACWFDWGSRWLWNFIIVWLVNDSETLSLKWNFIEEKCS